MRVPTTREAQGIADLIETNPVRPRPAIPVIERALRSLVPLEMGCWQSVLKVHRDSRVRINLGRRGVGADLVYRVVYEHLIGVIPPELEIDHLCRNPWCCNPTHMELVTHRENIRRSDAPMGIHARKTHCIRDHPFDADNTYVSRKGRSCKECRRMRDKAQAA